MEISSLSDVLEDQLRDLYSAENQLLKAIPKLVDSATSRAVKEALIHHLEETRDQVQRLETVGEKLDIDLEGKKCKGMEGLLEEAAECLYSSGDDKAIDVMLVAAAQRIEHYEISAYGTTIAIAGCLGYFDIVPLLRESLTEEAAADSRLTAICESDLYPIIEGVDTGGLEDERRFGRPL